MIRQAHAYLVSAMSGAALIAVAIAVFVVLVSAQVFKDWPIAALGSGGDESATVSPAERVPGTIRLADSPTGAKPVADRTGTAGKRADGSEAPGSVATGGALGAGGGSQVPIEPTRSDDTSTGAGDPETPNSPQAPSPSNPSAGAGASSPSTASAGGNAGAAGGSGGGGAATAGTTPSTSGAVTETVNGTVGKVDETALGGTLQESGVTTVTEGVVNGALGPESPVGKAVDETVGAVGGLLGGKR